MRLISFYSQLIQASSQLISFKWHGNWPFGGYKSIFLWRGVISKHLESLTPIISTSELSEMYGSISWLWIINHQHSYLNIWQNLILRRISENIMVISLKCFCCHKKSNMRVQKWYGRVGETITKPTSTN